MNATTKNTINRFVLLTGIVFLCAPIFGEISGNLKGRVIDWKNKPVELATATLTSIETMKTADGAMCDRNGSFTINDVTPGEYILSVSMVGYKKCESQNVKIEANATLVLSKDIVLKDSVQHLPGLVVTAKRLPVQKAAENGLALANASTSYDYINLFSYISKGYKCIFNGGIQIYDLTSSIKPIFGFSKNLFLN